MAASRAKRLGTPADLLDQVGIYPAAIATAAGGVLGGRFAPLHAER